MIKDTIKITEEDGPKDFSEALDVLNEIYKLHG